MKKGYSKLIIIGFLTFLVSKNGSSQNNQDCFSAIKVCTNSYLQTASSAGFGTVQEIASGVTCVQSGETNSTWYTFKIKSGGTLSFQIIPLNLQDDYDFVLYNLTGYNCTDIFDGTVQPLRCNFSSAPGSTGLSNGSNSLSSSSAEPNQNALLNVQQEETYILMVNNFTATNAGYELNFGGTATIYDTEAPEITDALVSPCSPVRADLYFSETVNCSSIATDGSDFRITGPSNVNITSASGNGCNSGLLAPSLRMNFAAALITPGIYKIHIQKGTDGNTVGDFCGNMISEGTVIKFEVTFEGPSAAIVSHTSTDCSNTGTATASVSGGTAPFTYSWNTVPVQNSLTAQNLSPGMYDFIAIDAHECMVSASVIIESTGIPELSSSVVPARCDSVSSGSATVNITGGIAPYSYQWNTAPVQTSATASGLPPGTYNVIVTGANGCTASTDITISLTGMPSINSEFTNVSCNGSVPGTATVVVTGTAPFTYQWSTSGMDTLPSISGLSQGSYTVTVTDAVGCTKTESVTIGAGGMQLNTTTVDLTCATIPSGSATVSALNGTSPYSYLWQTNPVQFDSVAVNLDKGMHTVIVTDAGGCKDSVTIEINSPPPLAINVLTTNSACRAANGSVSANVSGGIAPYVYQWSSGTMQNNFVLNNIAAGIYTVTVTDAAGCSATSPAYVSNPNGPQGFISDVVDATCKKPNGSASVVNVSGNAPFNYTWDISPPQYQPVANNLAEGIYYVMIKDSSNCVSFLHVKINAVPMGEVSIANISAASCGKNDGTATVTATGGMLPYQYEWFTNPEQTSSTAINLSAGNYLSVLTDGNGCKDSILVTMTENKAHNDFSFTPACLDAPVSFTAFTDYNQPVSWYWNFGDGIESQDNSTYESHVNHIFPSTNDYAVTLIMLGGCATDTIIKTVRGAYKPEASFTTKQQKYYATAPIQFIYTGSEVQQYEWNFDNKNFAYEENPAFAFKNPNDSAYVVLYVTDEHGCKDTAANSFYIDSSPAVFIPGGFTPNGDGTNDAFIIPSNGLSECKLQVVNRWGETVFTSANSSQLMSEGWNGNFNGKSSPEGTYSYLLRGKLENGKPVVYSGTVTLIR